uniref:Uncharacterized protein n=1 Tax=Hyaloperonospora arabidopsidis (strain Emoy2) TaxID=559515 RepID=M4C432_HYAAE
MMHHRFLNCQPPEMQSVLDNKANLPLHHCHRHYSLATHCNPQPLLLLLPQQKFWIAYSLEPVCAIKA